MLVPNPMLNLAVHLVTRDRKDVVKRSLQKMRNSLNGFNVRDVFTGDISSSLTCWCFGRFKGGKEASVEHAFFDTSLPRTFASLNVLL